MIRRVAVAGLLVQALVAACLLSSCFAVGRSPAEDAKRGAELGGAVGGLPGAGIGAALMVVLGAIVRRHERKPLVEENTKLRAELAALKGAPDARL